jgi:hypothetical protein
MKRPRKGFGVDGARRPEGLIVETHEFGIRGNLQRYLDEGAFRYNRRVRGTCRSEGFRRSPNGQAGCRPLAIIGGSLPFLGE